LFLLQLRSRQGDVIVKRPPGFCSRTIERASVRRRVVWNAQLFNVRDATGDAAFDAPVDTAGDTTGNASAHSANGSKGLS